MLDFNSSSKRTSSLSAKGATQVELEDSYSKYQLVNAISCAFIEDGFDTAIEKCGIPASFGIDLLVQLVLHKRADVATLVGILKKHFTAAENPAQACADMILKACEEDVCDWDPISSTVVLRYGISKSLQMHIDQYQYPLPMIEEPLPVRTNKDSGYYTIRRSIILKDNYHEDDVCLDHINRMNNQKLRLDQDTIAFMQNSWKNLDAKKEGETDDEFEARKRAFAKYDRVSRDVLDTLSLLNDGFWLTHKVDKRGRTYAQGYHVNYQGNDWNKACVQFARAEKLNKE